MATTRTRSNRVVKPTPKACEIAGTVDVDPPKKQKPASPPAKKTAGRSRKKMSTTTKAASKRKKSPKPSSSRKRAKATPAAESSIKKEDESREVKKPAKKAEKPKVVKPKVVVNQRLAERLDVYVFGHGEFSELGLGPEVGNRNVRRPRLNHLLAADTVGVVSLACGGMHGLALTYDGKVLSWGVNDEKSLGRDTTWDGLVRHPGEAPDDDKDLLNPYESTPTVVPGFPEGTEIVKVAAGDSISLALTDDGHVFGWGSFRGGSGVIGFDQDNKRQMTPSLYPSLSKIVDIVCGANHCLALSQNGAVYVWGCGEQSQLGRHINERLYMDNKGCLIPTLLRTGRKKFAAIFTGADHAFALDTTGNVLAWGANSFGATGIAEDAGEDAATVHVPTVVPTLSQLADPIVRITAGQNHSLALTSGGQALVFGRVDGQQCGIAFPSEFVPESALIYDDRDPPRPRILITPTALPGLGKAVAAAAGMDHNILINDAGEAYGWGIATSNQLGLGTTDDVEEPTRIENSSVRDIKFVWAGAGGQYSVLAAEAKGKGK